MSIARLVKDLSNDQVYCIPEDILIHLNSTFNMDSNRYNVFDFEILRDLATWDLFLILRGKLPAFRIPDDQMVHYLKKFQVRGIINRHKKRSYDANLSDIHLQGNVRNPEWAIIIMGASCNNHCIFCYTNWINGFPNFTSDQVKNAINKIADIGTARTLVFSGGEPTIRSDLPAMFEYANQVGFHDISLYTNGRELRKRPLLKKLVETGLKNVLFSLHGQNNNIHDEITRTRGSFAEAMDGLNNLVAFRVNIVVNIVIAQKNFEYLTDIIELLGNILIEGGTIRFSYPIVEGSAFDNVSRVIMSFYRLRSHILRASQFARDIGLNIEVANMPLCVLEELHCTNTYDKVALSSFVEASPFCTFNIPRGEKSVKLSSCIGCINSVICKGVQIEYLLAYPKSYREFSQVKPSESLISSSLKSENDHARYKD
jgi:organic radical activating enzyme